ncbi:MAG: hypothetical protein AAGD01_03330 [Acidobacteriota bacterium]
MTPPPPFARRWITAGCLFFALLPLGFLAGVAVTTRWLRPEAVGFDALGNGLGGGFTGALVVFLVGAVGVRFLSPRGRFTAAVLATIGASLCLIYLRSTAAERRQQAPAPATSLSAPATPTEEAPATPLTPKAPPATD